MRTTKQQQVRERDDVKREDAKRTRGRGEGEKEGKRGEG